MRYTLNNTLKSFCTRSRMSSALVLVLGCISLTGCKGDGELLEPTTLSIEDPERHYYPILQGQKKEIKIKITNTGDEPLKLYDVLPSCGCTIADFPKNAIAPDSEGLIKLTYNSIKNIGYVGIHTTIVANTKQKYHTVFFDLNVVPDALYTKDYEELYQIQRKEDLEKINEEQNRGFDYVTDSLEAKQFM